MNRFVIIVLGVMLGLNLEAQNLKLAYEADFNAFFDNREFSSEFAQSQTIFGARIAPEIGVSFNGNNRLMVGINYLQEFGNKSFDTRPDYTIYYQYTNDWFNGIGGSFGRRNLMGNYPTAMFADSIAYYDANLEGCLFQFYNNNGYVEFFCDWFGRQNDKIREKFMLGLAAEYNYKFLYAGLHAYMEHYAGTTAADTLIDNIIVHPHIGVRLADKLGVKRLNKLSLQVGMMLGMERARNVSSDFLYSPGVQVELEVEYWRVGIKNTFRHGQGMQKLYGQYESPGNRIHFGDPYYRASTYNRLELYCQIAKTKYVDFKFNSVFHSDGNVAFDWQQMLTLSVNLSNK
ncbi:MAG: hypothetical protein ACRC6V_13750 [Bacteroidales bacterium]